MRPSHLCGLLFTALLALAASYMYFLSASVIHVVMQKQISGEIHELNFEIAKLESNYIEKQHELSREVASLEGFIATENKIFIKKGDTGLAFVGE